MRKIARESIRSNFGYTSAMRSSLIAAALLALGGLACDRLFRGTDKGADAGAPASDAGPPWPESLKPLLPPGTRILRSDGNEYGELAVDAEHVFWSTPRRAAALRLVAGEPPVGVSVADIELGAAHALAEPKRIQHPLSEDGAFLYALEGSHGKKCTVSDCPVQSQTEVYRIKKSDGSSERVVVIDDWVESSVFTGGRLLLAGSMSGHLWAIEDGHASIVASGLKPHVRQLAVVGAALYVLSDAQTFYPGEKTDGLAKLALPLRPGAVPQPLTTRDSLLCIAGGDHLYGCTRELYREPRQMNRILRLDADGKVEAEFSTPCPSTNKNVYSAISIVPRGSRLYWFCGGLGEGYIAMNDVQPWH